MTNPNRKPRQRNFICTQPDCQTPSYAKGLCKHHYQINRQEQLTSPCRDPGCSIAPVFADGLCRMHYSRKNTVSFEAICRVETCDAKAVTNGCCAKHYAAEYRKDKAHREKVAADLRRVTCHIDGCRQPTKKENLCIWHYDDFRLVRNQGVTLNTNLYIQFKNKSQKE